jgi:hypothetical protein
MGERAERAVDRGTLSPADALEVLRTPPSAYTVTLLRGWFASTRSRPRPRFPATDQLEVPREFAAPPPGAPGEGDWDVRWAPNWERAAREATTVGRVAANNLIFSRSRELRSAVPYENRPWTASVVAALEQTVVDALLSKKISPEDAAWVVDRMQWLGFGVTNFVAPSLTIDDFRLPKSVARLKVEILAGPRGDALRAGDLGELGRVEAELTKASEGILRDDPGFEIYASGGGRNNFKNTAVMRGAIRRSDDPSVISVSTASLSEGIPAAEVPAYADLMVSASYGRSISTASGGYVAKQILAAMQTLVLDPDPESDCRTPLTMRVTLDDPREFLFRYYRGPGGRLAEVTPEAVEGLRGKVVEMRSPLYCGSRDGICSRCAGSLHHRMGITNLGLTLNRIGTQLLNNALKSFHDTKLKLKRIEFGKYVKEIV